MKVAAVLLVLSALLVVVAGLLWWRWLQPAKREAYQGLSCAESRRLMTEALQWVSQCCSELGLPFWLTCGTLLGWHREDDFICGDNDIDVAMQREDALQLLAASSNNSDSFSLYPVHCRTKGEKKLISLKVYKLDRSGWRPIKRLYGDIYITDQVGNEVQLHDCRKGSVSFPASMVYPLRAVSWKGCAVAVPASPADWLAANYGDDYMVPQAKKGRF